MAGNRARRQVPTIGWRKTEVPVGANLYFANYQGEMTDPKGNMTGVNGYMSGANGYLTEAMLIRTDIEQCVKSRLKTDGHGNMNMTFIVATEGDDNLRMTSNKGD